MLDFSHRNAQILSRNKIIHFCYSGVLWLQVELCESFLSHCHPSKNKSETFLRGLVPLWLPWSSLLEQEVCSLKSDKLGFVFLFSYLLIHVISMTHARHLITSSLYLLIHHTGMLIVNAQPRSFRQKVRNDCLLCAGHWQVMFCHKQVINHIQSQAP